MLFPKQPTLNQLHQPLLRESSRKQEKTIARLLNRRNSIAYSNQYIQNPSKNPSITQLNPQPPCSVDVSQELLRSAEDLTQEIYFRKDISSSHKRSIKVQFNKKRKQRQQQKPKNQNPIVRQTNTLSLSQSIYDKFEQEGLRLKANWAIPTKTKVKTFNSQIMNLDPRIQYFLYYMNLILNTVFRLSLIVILVLIILYSGGQITPMGIVVGMQVAVILLYFLAMTKMLYTRKDEQSIYLQKNFTDRDITDIEMDRVLRKHFTWNNILSNLSAYFKCNSKFKNDIKISILRQEIFKRIEIVICFIPFIVIFFTKPTLFRFKCNYPVEHIVTATICLEFVRMTVHYIVIFIQN